MTRLSKIVSLVVLALVLLPEKGAAQTGTLMDDGFLSTNPNTQQWNVNGHGTVLIVAGANASGNPGATTAFLKFQLQSSLPPNIATANVAKATLKLFQNSQGPNSSGAIDIYPVTSACSETTLNPSSPPTLAAVPFATGVSVGSKESFLVVDVTQLVQDWLNGPANGGLPNDGLALAANTGTTFAEFDSKENGLTSHEPRLEIILLNGGPRGPQGPAGPAGTSGYNGLQEFLPSGTFTVPSGITHISVELWAAGGGGGVQGNAVKAARCGDVGVQSICYGAPGGGGGAGGHSRAVLTVTPGTAYSVNLGTSASATSGTDTH